MTGIKRHCFIGVGKSAIVAHLLAETFSSCSIPSYHINAADAMHGGIGKYRPGDITVWISKSGETKEILNLTQYLPANISFTAKDSSLDKKSDEVYYIESGELFYNIPSKSILASLNVGYTYLMTMMSKYGLNEQDFIKNHPGGVIGERYANI